VGWLTCHALINSLGVCVWGGGVQASAGWPPSAQAC
jgi:hypothetical protein